MSGTDDTLSRLQAVIHERLGARVDAGARLSDLGVDSLRLAGFISDLEATFDFRAEPDIFDVETVQELADHIDQRCARR